ncbi:Alkaline ceramidase 3 [Terramyces sp. JEL0728]|nr:Alkaline ceramidase 3 [Terramyces sp. JEL0728]
MVFHNLVRNLTTVHTPYWDYPPTASVDWCEVNYEYTPYLAEFFNSMSSLALALAGVFGILLHPWAETRFKTAFGATIAVGLGSVAFHGTLSNFTQAADEVPMLYSALAFAYITLCQKYNFKHSTRTILAVALVSHAALTTYLVTAFEGKWQFILFHISFGTAQVFAVYQMFTIYRTHKIAFRDAECTRIFENGFKFYGFAFVWWIVDFTACDYVNPFYSKAVLPFNPQFHAWWHVFISIGLYNMGLFGLYDRMSQRLSGKEPRIKHFLNFVPYIVLQDIKVEKKVSYNTFEQ